MFIIVLCLLWSVTGLQMQMSCVATIWFSASKWDICVLTVYSPFLNKDSNSYLSGHIPPPPFYINNLFVFSLSG